MAFGVPADALDAHRCLEAYHWEMIPGTRIFPEVPETLALLREHGLKIGIVTNAHQPMWIRDVEITAHGLFDFFPDCRISAADVGYLKPHPVIFQTALRCLGTKPEETVFVGDDPECRHCRRAVRRTESGPAPPAPSPLRQRDDHPRRLHLPAG